MKELGVGLWGLGEHARRNIIPALRASTRCRLAGVTTRTMDVLRDVSATEGVPAFPDPAAMLAEETIQVVYLAVPTGLHVSLGRRILESGKHLWTEKPLAADPEEGLQLLDEASRRGLCVFDAAMFVHHPQFERLRSLVDEWAIGPLLSMVGRFGFPHLDPSNFRYSADAGGGAFLDAGYYPCAAAVAFLDAPIDVVGASLGRQDGFTVDTDGAALLADASGRTALLEWGFGRAYRNEIELWGATGSIFAQRAFSKPADLATTVTVRHQSGETVEAIPPANQFAAMLDAFAAAIAGGSVQDLTAATRTRTELMSAILASGRSGPGP